MNFKKLILLCIFIVVELSIPADASSENIQANKILSLATDFIERSSLSEQFNDLPVTTMSYAQTLDGSM